MIVKADSTVVGGSHPGMTVRAAVSGAGLTCFTTKNNFFGGIRQFIPSLLIIWRQGMPLCTSHAGAMGKYCGACGVKTMSDGGVGWFISVVLVDGTDRTGWLAWTRMKGAVKDLALLFDMLQVSIKVGGLGMGVAAQQAGINGINVNLDVTKGGTSQREASSSVCLAWSDSGGSVLGRRLSSR